jgi:hypothetical protein
VRIAFDDKPARAAKPARPSATGLKFKNREKPHRKSATSEDAVDTV